MSASSHLSGRYIRLVQLSLFADRHDERVNLSNAEICLQYEYYGSTSDKKVSKKRRKKDKDSDSEDATLVQS